MNRSLKTRILALLADRELPTLAIASALKLGIFDRIFLYSTLWKMAEDGLLERRLEEDTTGDRGGFRRAYYRVKR